MASEKKAGVQELASVMFTVGRFMREHMQKRMAGTHCPSILHLEALRYIKENGKPLMRDVAKSFSITPPAATLLIESLAKDKLLTRVVDPKDRRTVRLALTPGGRRMFERGVKDRMQEIKRIFSVLSAEERGHLVVILKKIIKGKK